MATLKRKVIGTTVLIVFGLSAFITLKPTPASHQGLLALNARYFPAGRAFEGPSFLLSFNDHNLDINNINFAKISFIQLDDGELLSASGWRLIRSGHHALGKLYFQPLTTTDSKRITLIIANKYDEKRVFGWAYNDH